MIDFFNHFDKDGSMSVTREEFAQGIEVRSSANMLCALFYYSSEFYDSNIRHAYPIYSSKVL